MQFTVPKLVQNEINVQWDTPVQAVHCPRGWGEEKIVTDPRQMVKEWRAQFGYESEVSLRWSTAAGHSTAKAIEIKEMHFWDVRPSAQSLSTTITYAINQGSLAQLVVSMPDALQVRNVEATATTPFGQSVPIRIKHWSVVGKGTNRQLLVGLAQPAAGNLTLNLEMAPRAFGSQVRLILPLPVPQQGKSTGVVSYRIDTPEARSIMHNLVAVQSISVADFDKQWKKKTGASQAKSFQRTNLQASSLELLIEPSARQAAFHLTWEVDRSYADVTGEFNLSSRKQDLRVLGFLVDNSVALAEVAGPDVRRWNLQDSLLQVWLDQPRKETSIKIKGWRKSAPAQKFFVLPCIYPLEAQNGAGTLTLRAAPGLLLQDGKLSNLQSDPNEPTRFAINKLPYHASIPPKGKTPYAASFDLRAAPVSPEATMLTMVSPLDSKIEGSVAIRLLSQGGELPELKIRVKNWDDQPWQLVAPSGVTVQRSTGQGTKQATWVLKFPPGLPQEVFVTLRGRLGRTLSDIEIEGAAVRERWLAWRDVEVHGPGGAKLTSNQRGIKDKLAPFLADAWFRQSSPWYGAEYPKSLSVVLPRSSAQSGGRVVAGSEETWLSENAEWLREATLWAQADERTDLWFRFSAPVDSLSAWTGTHLQSVAQSARSEYALTLNEKSIGYALKLRWKYANGGDDANIANMQLDNGALLAHERLVWVPNGMTPSNADLLHAPTYAARLLRDSELHLEIAAVLAQDVTRSKEIAARAAMHLRHFNFCIRQAEYALSIVKHGAPEIDVTPLLKRVSDLAQRNTNLASQPRTVGKSGNSPLFFESRRDPVSGGIPVFTSPDMPDLKLVSNAEQRLADRRARSEFVLLAALFLFVFSYFRYGWWLLRLAGPEIAVGLIVLAMTLYGVGLLGVAMVAAILAGRLMWLAAALRNSPVPHSAVNSSSLTPATP